MTHDWYNAVRHDNPQDERTKQGLPIIETCEHCVLLDGGNNPTLSTKDPKRPVCARCGDPFDHTEHMATLARLQRETLDSMRAMLKAGIQVVSAPQLFPTPRDLAERMVSELCIESGMAVLEPSAGTGVLLEALARSAQEKPADLSVVAVEINQRLADQLRGRWSTLDLRCSDFLACNGDLGTFDRIIMNPPFEKGSDIAHIKHALTMLKPGGKLVALCANGPRQQEALRPLATEWEELPEGTFKEQGTSVRVALMTVEA